MRLARPPSRRDPFGTRFAPTVALARWKGRQPREAALFRGVQLEGHRRRFWLSPAGPLVSDKWPTLVMAGERTTKRWLDSLRSRRLETSYGYVLTVRYRGD